MDTSNLTSKGTGTNAITAFSSGGGALNSARSPGATSLDPVFASVVCAVDKGPTTPAARRQAAALAAPSGAVEWLSAPGPADEGYGALLDRCNGADVLVLGGGVRSPTVLEHASVPVLLARPCPLGDQVADRIVVAVDEAANPERAAKVAGLLAARHEGEVVIAPAPAPNARLQRATAASRRIVLRTSGDAPRVFGVYVPPERLIPSVAITLGATLLVLPVADTDAARRRAVLIARCVACSVLALPVPTAIPQALAFAQSPTNRSMERR
jgi:hypothetical protein